MRKKTGKEKINKIDKVDDMANCFVLFHKDNKQKFM